jgi:hypothetical protein
MEWVQAEQFSCALGYEVHRNQVAKLLDMTGVVSKCKDVCCYVSMIALEHLPDPSVPGFGQRPGGVVGFGDVVNEDDAAILGKSKPRVQKMDRYLLDGGVGRV